MYYTPAVGMCEIFKMHFSRIRGNKNNNEYTKMKKHCTGTFE